MSGYNSADIVILDAGDTFHWFETSDTPFQTPSTVNKAEDPVIFGVTVYYATRDDGTDCPP